MTSHKPIRVLALSPIPEEGAGYRFRVSQYIPYLTSKGFDVTVESFYTPEFFRLVYRPGHFVAKSAGFMALVVRRLSVLRRLKDYDLVFLYREAIPIGPPVIERAIANRGLPMVLDFDDALFLPSVSDANKAIGFLKSTDRIAEVIKLSTHVIAGNSFLGDYARRLSPAVSDVATAVDTDRFVPRRVPAAPSLRGPVVGWIGSPTTYPYVETIAPLLKAVAARHRFVLRISGAGKAVRIDGVDVEELPWSLDREVELFNTCDIGIYPLPDDDWARGKCGFKAIQFMSCGVPVVAAAVGVNRDIIHDGEDSFLASTPEEWVAKLERLLTDAELRTRFALAGRQTIDERYSLRVTAPRIERILREAVTTRT